MPIPASVQFDLCDWNARYADTTDAGDVGITDGTDPLRIYATYSGSVRFTDDQVSLLVNTPSPGGTARASLHVPNIAVPSSYSFEFDFIPVSLPPDFRSGKAFVGVINLQGTSIGLAFSMQGVALTTSSDSPTVSVLGGSRSLIVDENGDLRDSVTFRIVVDGDEGNVTVYAADTSTAYDTVAGTGWADQADLVQLSRIRIPSGSSPVLSDGIHVALLSSAKTDIAFVLESVRLSSALLAPTRRPLAVISGPIVTSVLASVPLYGSRSSDADRLQLEYEWDIDNAPLGSTARMTGAQFSQAELGNLAGDNHVVVMARTASTQYNDWSLVLQEVGLNATISAEVDEDSKVLRVNTDTDGVGVCTTTAEGLVSMLTSPQAYGLSTRISALFSADYGSLGMVGAGVVPVGTYAFSGGAGSTLRDPSLIPDKVGVYTISLRVSNGSWKSQSVQHVLRAQASDQLMGHKPDSSYIFRYLPDFWNLVEGRESLETVWSAITQVLGSDLLTAWQNDYAKSIRDVGRYKHRKWQRLDMYVDTAAATVTVSGPSAAVYVTATTADVTTGYDTVHAEITGPNPLSRGLALVMTDGAPPYIANISGFIEVGSPVTGYKIVSSDRFYSFIHVQSGTAGEWSEDPLVPGGPTDMFRDAAYNVTGDEVGWRLRTYAEDIYANGTVYTVGSIDGQYLRLTGAAEDITGVRLYWDLVKKPSALVIEQTPYLTTTGVDLSDLELGDIAVLKVSDMVTGEELDAAVTIRATDEDSILFVDWEPLLVVLKAVRAQSAVANLHDEASEQERTDARVAAQAGVSMASISELHITLSRIVRHRRSAAKDDLVSVPELGKASEMLLSENTDYRTTGSRVEFIPAIAGAATVSGRVVTFDSDVVWNVSATDTSYDGLSAAGFTGMVLESGDAGVYSVVASSGRTFTLDAEPRIQGSVTARLVKYHLDNVPSDWYWAELAVYDNWRTIQSHFGVLVGLPRQSLLDVSSTADYLDVVRSMVMAFVCGPTLRNMERAVQAMFSVPYAEAAGVVRLIDEPTGEDERGRILVLGDDGIYRTYTYPYGAALSKNVLTGNTIAAFQDELFDGLNLDEPDSAYIAWLERRRLESFPADQNTRAVFDEKLEAWKDARLLPGDPLVDVVSVDDYVSNQDLMATLLPGQEIIRQYHTFAVSVPLDIVGSTKPFSLVREFLTAAKPAHTNFILFGSLPVFDEIDVEEQFIPEVTLHLIDTPHSPPYYLSPTGDIEELWPETETLLNPPGAPSWDEDDVYERHESGFTVGMLDDYSGDGSYNSEKSVVDFVNNLDSDIDVVMSLMWVPIQKTGSLDDEFVVGEMVDFLTDLTPETPDPYIAESPPVIRFIGVGEHPRLTNVWGPQGQHPYTYLLLAFDNRDFNTVSNYGAEERIRKLFDLNQPANPDLRIKGRTSGAYAIPDPQDYTVPNSPFYIYEYMFRIDKMLDNTPAESCSLQLTAYIDTAGEVEVWTPGPVFTPTVAYIEKFESLTPSFLRATGLRLDHQLQQYPYNSLGTGDPYFAAPADNTQFVPSFHPGFYSDWDLTNLAADDVPFAMGTATKANYRLRWDYTDLGQMVANPPVEVPLQFAPNISNSWHVTTLPGWETDVLPYLKNVHIGITRLHMQDRHYTHGFTPVKAIPPPKIYNGTYDGAVTVRIEGFHFTDDDPTRVAIPTDTTFDGLRGGSWVFIRDSATLVETAAASINFVTGPGVVTVMGLPGPLQTSTGHVIEATFAAAPPANAVYDVIIRQYRPYVMHALGAPMLHIDADIIVEAFTTIGGGFGLTAFGIGGFGGVP